MREASGVREGKIREWMTQTGRRGGEGVEEDLCHSTTVDPEIFALNVFRLLIFRVVLFSSLEHTDEN